jgi:hypothetical protein
MSNGGLHVLQSNKEVNLWRRKKFQYRVLNVITTNKKKFLRRGRLCRQHFATSGKLLTGEGESGRKRKGP